MRFSVSRISVWPLRVSTRDQSGIVLYNLNFDSPKFSLLNLNEVWIAINTWSFSLIFFFSSSLEFFLTMCCYQMLEISKEGHLNSSGCETPWDARPKEGVYRIPKRRERERKRGHGESLWVWGAAGFDALGTLWEVPLNRHEDWILFNLIIQVLFLLGFLII